MDQALTSKVGQIRSKASKLLGGLSFAPFFMYHIFWNVFSVWQYLLKQATGHWVHFLLNSLVSPDLFSWWVNYASSSFWLERCRHWCQSTSNSLSPLRYKEQSTIYCFRWLINNNRPTQRSEIVIVFLWTITKTILTYCHSPTTTTTPTTKQP